MRITREYLESLENKKVKITLFDDTPLQGVLQKGNGFFYEPKKYIIGNTCFRLTHIKKIEVL